MNLPFGLPTVKELGLKKKEEAMETAALFEHKLAEYKITLESYKRYIEENLGKQEAVDRRPIEDQLSIVQMALDLTYLKEQGEKLSEQMNYLEKGSLSKISSELEGLVTSFVDTNYKLEGLDKNVVSRISELLVELQKQSTFQMKQHQTEQLSEMEALENKVKRNGVLLWFLFIFNLLSLSGIIFLILYIFELISF